MGVDLRIRIKDYSMSRRTFLWGTELDRFLNMSVPKEDYCKSAHSLFSLPAFHFSIASPFI